MIGHPVFRLTISAQRERSSGHDKPLARLCKNKVMRHIIAIDEFYPNRLARLGGESDDVVSQPGPRGDVRLDPLVVGFPGKRRRNHQPKQAKLNKQSVNESYLQKRNPH